jgi:ADP-heptose:LPS heptosyltransferase/GT2 family glycosyltransferase
MLDLKIPIFVMFHNNFEWTKVCVDFLRKNTPKDLYRLIFIDNGSLESCSEKTYQLMEDGDDKVVFNKPVGVALSYNKSIKEKVGDSKYFITLHNDVLVSSGWLDEILWCVEKLESDNFKFSCVFPRTNYCFVGTPVMKDENIRDIFVTQKKNNKKINYESDIYEVLEKTYSDYDEFVNSEVSCEKGRFSIVNEMNSFCTLFKTNFFFDIGGFDKDFVSHGYDCNLFNFYASKKDVYPVFSHGAYVHHNGNTTSDGFGKDFVKDLQESESLYNKKVQEEMDRERRILKLNTKINNEKIKVLMIRDCGIGDIIMSLFAMKGLKQELNEGVELTVATGLEFMKFVSFIDCVDKVIPLECKLYRSTKEIKEISDMYSENFDLVINLIGMFESARKDEAIHRIERARKFIEDSDIGEYVDKIPIVCPSFNMPDRLVGKILDNIPKSKFPRIAIAPYGSCLIRSLPDNLIKKIVSMESVNKQVLVLGKEKDSLNLELNNNIIDLRGQLESEELPAIIGSCEYIYTSDSGSFHIAGLMGIPCRAFFGSIHPSLRDGFYPSSEENTIYFKENLVCSPCFDVGCKKINCMQYSDDEIERIVVGEYL